MAVRCGQPTVYAKEERKLNSFHLRCFRRILGISWRDKVTNREVLARVDLPTMHTKPRQRRLRWLGYVRRMENGRIPKDLYGELASGKRSVGRPQLHFKDVYKRDMRTLNIDYQHWEDLADDQSHWPEHPSPPAASGVEGDSQPGPGKTETPQGTHPQPARDCLQMRPLWSGLPLPHWPYQSYQTLFQPQRDRQVGRTIHGRPRLGWKNMRQKVETMEPNPKTICCTPWRSNLMRGFKEVQPHLHNVDSHTTTLD